MTSVEHHDLVVAAIESLGGEVRASFVVGRGEAWQRDPRGSTGRTVRCTNCGGRGHNSRTCMETSP